MSIFSSFKGLLHETIDFAREDFSWAKYAFALVLIAALNYAQIGFDIYHLFIAPARDAGIAWCVMPLFYTALYLLMLIPTLAMSRELYRLKQWQVWVFPVMLFMLQCYSQYNAFRPSWFTSHDSPLNEKLFTCAAGYQYASAASTLLGLCVFKWISQGRLGLFGLKRNAAYINVYITTFLVMFPFLVVVSRSSEMLSYYPVFHYWDASGAYGMSDWQLAATHDIGYGLDFLAVESMFRGALVIGLTRWLGPRAVLPMVITYVAIHIGKPSIEMMSSGIGGYLLGILAHRTGHLWGGVIIHVAIALTVEVLSSVWHLTM